MKPLRPYYLLFTIFSIAFLTQNINNASALELTVSGNGAASENQVSTDQSTTTTVEQSNEAQVSNNINNNANTGENTSSDNNGDTTTQTGNVDSSSAVSNNLNTSIVNNPCCDNQDSSVTVSGNGADSTNSVTLNQSTNTTVSINQQADIYNNTSGESNTGRNTSNNNLGDTFTQTGNINVDSRISNDDNLAKVILGQGSGNVNVSISGNGPGSVNNVNINNNSSFNSFIFNEALIFNNSHWDANTGDNTLNGNIGDVRLITGDVTITSTINNRVNFSEFLLSCCEVKEEVTPPAPTEEKPPSGGEQPTSQPSAPAPSAPGAAALEQVGQVLGAAAMAGGILPFTGSWMLILMTLIAFIMFTMGLYLRLHPGRDPS